MIRKSLNSPLRAREVALIVLPLLAIPAAVVLSRLREARKPSPTPLVQTNSPAYKPLPQVGRSSGSVAALAFSPDGRVLATADVAGRVRWWNASTGKLQKKLTRPKYPYGVKRAREPLVNNDMVTAMAYSRDGHLLAVTLDSALWLLDGRNGKFIRALSEPIGAGELERRARAWRLIRRVAPGQTVTVTSKGAFQTGSSPRVVPGPPSRLGKAPSAGQGQRPVGTPAPTMKPVSTKLMNDAQLRVLKGLAISPDGETVAAGSSLSWPYFSREAKVCVWDARTGRLKASLPLNLPQVDGLDISPDNRRLAVYSFPQYKSGDKGTVQLWDLATRKKIWQADVPTVSHDLQFSANGQQLVVGGQGPLLLSAATGKPQRKMTMGRGSVNAVVFQVASRAQLVLGGVSGSPLGVWNVKDGRFAEAQPIHTDAFGASVDLLTISPDQKRLAYVDNTGAVQMWDISQLKVDFNEKKILSGPKRLWRQPKVVTPLGEE